nr:MAG TPA: Rho termination factor, N-terminal domain [Caudoviricetes sp.]
MTRNELENMNKTEVAKVAKDLGVKRYKGKSMLSKKELIDGICKVMESNDDVTDAQKAISEAGEQEKKVEIDRDAKDKRIISAPLGTLIAFYEPETNKLNTAKLTNRNKVKRLIKCETQYGKEFLVPFENIRWVKTGSRWPKGIYNELKGKKADAGKEKQYK